MHKESNIRKELKYSIGVKIFICGLFLATLLFMVFGGFKSEVQR